VCDEKKVCGNCGQECDVITIDEGIGIYEFWGDVCTHHEYVDVSECCHSEALYELDEGYKV